jgi:hypothetical protein
MKKLGIPIFFFTLCILISSASFAQAKKTTPWQGTITLNGEILQNPGNIIINGDTISGDVAILPDSSLKSWNGFISPKPMSGLSKHYLSKDGERYYIEIVPPALKGKRVDDSNIWLLGDEVAQAWH